MKKMVKLKNNFFIWTEAIGCGEILPPMVKSYLAHHDYILNIFGTKNDLAHISSIKDSRINQIDISSLGHKFLNKIAKFYRKGHLGTAFLWQNIITTQPENFLIHLDADTVFLADNLEIIIRKLTLEKYALCGGRRPYKNRTYRKSGLDGILLNSRPDVVNTDCFGFNKLYVNTKPSWWLRRKIVGRRTSFKPVVDFFDPVSFEILRNHGTIFFTQEHQLSNGEFPGNSINRFATRISFAAVGSGLNFYRNPGVKTSSGYREFALSSFATYSKWLLGREIESLRLLDDPELSEALSRLDHTSWTLEN